MAELDEILAGREPAPVETKETQPEPKTEAEAAPETTQEEADTKATVPVAALQKEREKAKRYTEQVADFERRLAEQDQRWQQRFEQIVASLQPKAPEQPNPDFFEDPDAAIGHRLEQALTPIQQAMLQQREEMSRMMAAEKFGQETVNEAYAAIAGMKATQPAEFDALYRQIMSSPHPYGALVEWHGKQKALAEIGPDPAAYREKLKAEILAELQASGATPQANGSPAMPSNFATARNVGARSGPAWGGPTSLADIFKR